MREPVDSLFDQFRDPGLAQEGREDARQSRFEEWVVKSLLRYAKVQISVGVAVRHAKEKYGHDALDFNWFREEIGRFPAELGSAKLPRTAEVYVNQLFGSGWAKTPWMKAYMKSVATYGWNVEQDRCALFFNLPHADQSYTMVLHNQPVQATLVEDPEQRSDEYFTRVVRPFGNPKVVYILESLKSFMQTIGTDWASDLCQHPS